MAVTTKTVNSATVYYEDQYYARWLDAFGQDVVKKIFAPCAPCDDQTTNLTEWTVTETDAGTGDTSMTASTTLPGELYLITTAQNEYDGVNAQANGTAFDLSATHQMYFGCKFYVSDATQTDVLIGLCKTKTDNIKVASSHGITATNVEGVFMWKADGGTTMTFKSYASGTETNTANYGTALDTSAHIFEMYWDGTTLTGYIDNTLVGTFSSLPTGYLRPTICFNAGATGAAKTMNVTWLRVIQVRD